jgi:hypothetical protein
MQPGHKKPQTCDDPFSAHVAIDTDLMMVVHLPVLLHQPIRVSACTLDKEGFIATLMKPAPAPPPSFFD